MEKATLTAKEISEIREIAKLVAEDPDVVSLTSAVLSDITKKGKKELTKKSIQIFKDVGKDYFKDFPEPVFDFLEANILNNKGFCPKGHRNARLLLFVDYIQKCIIKKINERYVSAKNMQKYSEMFNISVVKRFIPPTFNELRLAFAVALGQNDQRNICNSYPELADDFCNIFENVSQQQIKDLFNVANYMKTL